MSIYTQRTIVNRGKQLELKFKDKIQFMLYIEYDPGYLTNKFSP